MNATINIAKLVAACGKIEGRKKLQKIVHILQCRGFVSAFPQQFGYLHYGPYSHEVKADLDALTAPSNALVSETEGVAGLSYRSFEYRATNTLIAALGTKGAEAWEPLAKELNGFPAQDLEAMSTILYLKKSGVPDSQVRSRFTLLKPALADRLDNAVKAVAALPSASA